jgi:glutamate decarboxylase
MVHINRVATSKEVQDARDQYKTTSAPNPNSTINLTPDDEADDYTATVYGSRYATEDLPRHEMPEKEMPAQIAYRMIKDDLTLDGTPTLNLASFVTTYMEEEAEKLMVYVHVEFLHRDPANNQPTVTPSPRTSSTTKSTLCPPTSRTAASP